MTAMFTSALAHVAWYLYATLAVVVFGYSLYVSCGGEPIDLRGHYTTPGARLRGIVSDVLMMAIRVTVLVLAWRALPP